MGRRIDGTDLERSVADIYQIVPRSGGNDHRAALRHLAAAVHLIPAGACQREGASALHPDELIRVAMNLRADVSTDGNTHQRHLQILARPKHRPVIPVACCEAIHIHNGGLSAAVDSAASAVIHIPTSY